MGRPKKLSDDECLERAFEVISREGFESFTLEQVARAVDLSPAALIKRFGTKERLARAARDRKWDVNFEQMAASESQSLRGLAALFHFVKLIARSVDSKRLGEHMRLLGSQADDPRSKRKVAAYFRGTRERVAICLREACEDAEIRALDIERIASTLEALIQGAIFQFGFLEGRGIEAHLRGHVRTFLEPYLNASSKASSTVFGPT
jgi:AcrR family transcriptional regulator